MWYVFVVNDSTSNFLIPTYHLSVEDFDGFCLGVLWKMHTTRGFLYIEYVYDQREIMEEKKWSTQMLTF